MKEQYNTNDFFKIIFEFYESNELFDMNDLSLKEHRKLLSEASKDLYNFIESNFSDEVRNSLKCLLYKKITSHMTLFIEKIFCTIKMDS